jgi:hypothetical protein
LRCWSCRVIENKQFTHLQAHRAISNQFAIVTQYGNPIRELQSSCNLQPPTSDSQAAIVTQFAISNIRFASCNRDATCNLQHPIRATTSDLHTASRASVSKSDLQKYFEDFGKVELAWLRLGSTFFTSSRVPTNMILVFCKKSLCSTSTVRVRRPLATSQFARSSLQFANLQSRASCICSLQSPTNYWQHRNLLPSRSSLHSPSTRG